VSTENSTFRKRDLIVPVFLPSLLFTAGEGAIIPILPAAAEKMGANLAMAGLLGGIILLGTVLFDLPAGRVVAVLGERRSMILSALIAAAALIGAQLSTTLIELGACMVIIGAMNATFGLARHSYLAENVPFEQRARTLSLMGGMFRGGGLIGPLIGSAVIFSFGLNWVYTVAVSLALISAIILYFGPKDPISEVTEAVRLSPAKIIYKYRERLFSVGLAAMLVSVMRTARSIGLPLWGIYIHMHPGQVELIIGIAGALDFALFYVSGQVMDKFGRRWALIPMLVGMAIANFALLGAHDSTTFLLVALLMSVANATGSGVVLTLGADISPAEERSDFLAVFRVLTDGGSAATPMLLSALTALIALPGATLSFGLLSIFGAFWGHRSLNKMGIR
jgi:MFS family permease